MNKGRVEIDLKKVASYTYQLFKSYIIYKHILNSEVKMFTGELENQFVF